MANTLEILIQAKDQASKELEGVSKSLDGMSKQLKVIGAAMTAVGAAGLKMVADARQLNATLGMTAITLGTTDKAMRQLAIETADAGFRLGEVTQVFDLLARAGIRDTEILQKTAIAFDELSGAIGSTASAVTEQMIMAMKTYGLSAEEIAAQTDKITYLVRNTALSMDNFASIVGYVTPELVQMGLTMDDTIALLAIMESKGVSGAVATRVFRSAITEATTAQIPLNEALGVTSDELDNYKSKLADSEGMTKLFNDESDKAITILDKLKDRWEKLTLAAGSFLTPLEPILALMTALGPVMILFSTAQGKAFITTMAMVPALIAKAGALIGLQIALVGATAKMWLLNIAMSANPIGLIILAIAGLITGIVLLIKNWDKVKDALGKVWDWMKTTFQKVGDFFKKVWDGIVDAFKAAANFIAGIINGLIGGFESFLNFFVNGLNFFINGINRIIGGINKILPGAIELAVIPTIESVKLGRIPLMDSGGLIRGPGVFQVGPGVTEIAREPSSGEVHIHVGYLLGDELSLNKFARIIKQRIQQDDRRTAFGPVNQGYYYGRSST